MIKLINILNEESMGNSFTTIDSIANRKILNLVLKHHPELKTKLMDYYKNSETLPYRKNYVYRTITNFMEAKAGIYDTEIMNQVTLLFLINPYVTDFLNEKLENGSNNFFTYFEYTGDEIEVYDEWENETCDDCRGYGTSECNMCNGNGVNGDCYTCDGTGEIEDEDGEEGDTLVCDECNGGGEETCEWCAGDGESDCEYCDGHGEVEKEFQSHQLNIYTKRYISFEPLNDPDVDLRPNRERPIDYFMEINEDKKILLWDVYNDKEYSKNDDSEIVNDLNDVIDFKSEKLTNWDFKYSL